MIQLLPTLSPRQFLHTSKARSLPFPLNYPRARYYYFARNGVWEAAEILGLQPGDEVLMPAYCSGLEVEAFEARGVVPVFYRLTKSLEPDFIDAREKITSRTKVFYLIHYFGFPQPLDAVSAFCAKQRLFFFEDNALGLLSADARGRSLGSTGDVALFCPRKTLPLPHGGMLIVNNADIPAPSYRQCAPSHYSTIGETASLMVRHAMRYPGPRGKIAASMRATITPLIKRAFAHAGITHTESGGGSFDATKTKWAMARVARKLLLTFDFHTITMIRRDNYELLTRCLMPLHGTQLTIVFPELTPHCCPLEYMVLVKDASRVSRFLAARGIESGLHWWWERPRRIASQFPNLKPFTDQALLLPIHQDLCNEDVMEMAQELTNIVKHDIIASS